MPFPRSTQLPVIAGTFLLVTAVWLGFARKPPTIAMPGEAPLSSAKSRLRASLPTRPESFADVLSAAKRTPRTSLESWARSLEMSPLIDLIREGVPALAGLPDGPEARSARLLLTVLASEAGRRDMPATMRALHVPYSELHPVANDTLFRELLAIAIAAHAANDPADAWQRMRQFHAEGTLGACGTGLELGNVSFGQPNLSSSEAETPTTRAATGALFEAWARRDPDAALQAIREFPEMGDAGTARFPAAILGFAKVCPETSLPQLREEIERRAAERAAKPRTPKEDDVPLLGDIPVIGRLFQPSLPEDALAFLHGWLPRDPAAALEWYARQPYGAHPDRLLESLASESPVLAEPLLDPDHPGHLAALADGLLASDPQRALTLLHRIDPADAAARIEMWLTSPANHADDGAWPVTDTTAPSLSEAERRELILSHLDSFPFPEATRRSLEAKP